MSDAVSFDKSTGGFLLASRARPTPIYYDVDSPEALVIAVNTFADDIERVIGDRPPVLASKDSTEGILVGIVGSDLVKAAPNQHLQGQWESWDISFDSNRAVVTGSDKVSLVHD